MKRTTKTRGKSRAETDFDSEGVRHALLAAMQYLYRSFPHITLPQYLIALEVLAAEKEGQPHTLASLVKKLDMPFSTASRVVWSLTEEGGEIAVVKYRSHPTDRRKKYLVAEPNSLPMQVMREVNRSLTEYYGDSLQKLKRAAPKR